MKSYNPSFLQFRRAVVAVAVLLSTGAAVAVAQGTDNAANSAQTNPSSNDNNSNSNMSPNNSGSDMSNSSSAENASDTNANSSSSKSKLSWSDRHFIEKTAAGNQQEIQLAQLAADRASNPDVKSFAQQLVQDHTKLGQDLQTLAQSNNITLKEENKEDHEYKKLASLSGTDFDSRFIKRMVSEHKKDIKEFKDRADDAKNADLKAFAQNQLPTLQHHLEMAQSLESSIVPTGRMDTKGGRDYSNANATSSSSSLNMTGNATAPAASGTSNAASGTSSTANTGATSSTSSTQ